MMSPETAINNYVSFIAARTNLSEDQKNDIKESLGVLVNEIINQVKLATIVAIDAEQRPVTFTGIT